jgi:arylsulfatase A-like enzyme
LVIAVKDPNVPRIAVVGTLAAVLAATACAPARESERPSIRNVLVISADDHAAYAMGAYGNEVIRTPNLDRLATEGVRFERAYVNCPFCTPSRQSLITGKYPHGCGVTLLQTPLAEEQVTIADHLGALGFKTAAIGKMHFNSDLKHGFDFRIDAKDHDTYLRANPARKPPADQPYKPVWRPFRVPARDWLNADRLPGTGYPRPGDADNQGLYDDDFLGTFYVRQAVDFMRTNRDERMCVWLSFYEPHSPFNFPIEFASKHAPSAIDLPETSPEDDRWIPAIFRDLSDADKRGITAAYYNSVAYLDSNVGRMLDALEEAGLSDSTLVAYISDHGYLLGHHGRFEKHMMWEEIVRVPMVIRYPGLAPRAEPALVEMVDLAPTILDILGVDPMGGVDGRSLLGLLRGEATEHRDVVFSEYLHDNKAMVRTDRWKYVFTTGKADLALGYQTGRGPSGRDQRLYDMANDSRESLDLADDSQNAEVIGEMQAKMLDIFLRTHPRAPGLPGELTVEEQLEWFLEPPENHLAPSEFLTGR